jgi:uncharacterized protein YcbK (DUF882 family)
MGDLTRNISRHEVACKCGCGKDTIDYELVEIVQSLVDWFQNQSGAQMFLKINSGNRCERHNAAERGEPKSLHLQGRALDFYLVQKGGLVISPPAVSSWLAAKYPNKYGIGWYNGFTHFDTRTGAPHRWDNRH